MNIPRRIQVERMVPAELAIRSAIQEVEKLAADARLTEAVILLNKAQDKVADYIDELCIEGAHG